VLPGVVGVVISSLDTFVETVENIPTVDDFVVTAVELSTFVNPEAPGNKEDKSEPRHFLELHDIT
jgi:hypothetical protein